MLSSKLKLTLVLLYILNTGSFAASTPPLSSFLQIHHVLSQYHLNTNGKAKQLESDAIQGLLKTTNDPYTKLLSPSRYRKMKQNQSGQSGHIGVELGNREDRIIVISLLPNSPAKAAGLRPLDEIIAVDGKPVKGYSSQEAQALLQGKPNQPVAVTIRRETAFKPLTFSVTRKNLPLLPIQTTTFQNGLLGYLKIEQLTGENTASEFKTLVKKHQQKGIQGLIIDLRDNGGGLLRQAVDITDTMIPKGPLVHITSRSHKKTTKHASGNAFFTAPIVVLVNEGTASSAEVLAATLQDHKRAILVGTQTFGKTSVQRIFPLKNGSALICTVAKYLTPSGRDISNAGLKPDHQVKVPDEHLEIIQSPYYQYQFADDIQLQYGLNLLLDYL